MLLILLLLLLLLLLLISLLLLEVNSADRHYLNCLLFRHLVLHQTVDGRHDLLIQTALYLLKDPIMAFKAMEMALMRLESNR